MSKKIEESKLPERLQKLLADLKKERKELLKKLDELDEPVEFGNDLGDFDEDEEADEAEANAVNLSESQVVRERLNEVDHLINKILANEYGICDICGRKIDQKYLKNTPDLIFCKICLKNKSFKNKKEK